jgi:hypothetical protein
MRADRSIQALVSDDEPFNRPASDEVFAYDLGHVFNFDSTVPDSFRIDDDRWTMLALVEASGLVHADRSTNAGGPHSVLERCMQLAFAVVGTGGPSAPRFAKVRADKNVALKFRQSKLLVGWCFLIRFYWSFPPAGYGVD